VLLKINCGPHRPLVRLVHWESFELLLALGSGLGDPAGDDGRIGPGVEAAR
jgi:hypothetical protein